MDLVRASYQIVPFANRSLDGFMLPSGSYRMSMTQTGECVDQSRQNVSDFLRSKAFKDLHNAGYTSQKVEIPPSLTQQRGSSRIDALPLEIVGTYWAWQVYRGNKTALTLIVALTKESLERRFDNAFGIQRTEQEYNERLIVTNQALERQLEQLGTAYAHDDDLAAENRRLVQQLRALGHEPWNV